jgi:hypothetical protein
VAPFFVAAVLLPSSPQMPFSHMKIGTAKARAEEELRVNLDQVAKGVFLPD